MATCFDLVGHPRALQENRSNSCLVFLQCGIPNAHKFQLHQLYKLVQIELFVWQFELKIRGLSDMQYIKVTVYKKLRPAVYKRPFYFMVMKMWTL